MLSFLPAHTTDLRTYIINPLFYWPIFKTILLFHSFSFSLTLWWHIPFPPISSTDLHLEPFLNPVVPDHSFISPDPYHWPTSRNIPLFHHSFNSPFLHKLTYFHFSLDTIFNSFNWPTSRAISLPSCTWSFFHFSPCTLYAWACASRAMPLSISTWSFFHFSLLLWGSIAYFLQCCPSVFAMNTSPHLLRLISISLPLQMWTGAISLQVSLSADWQSQLWHYQIINKACLIQA